MIPFKAAVHFGFGEKRRRVLRNNLFIVFGLNGIGKGTACRNAADLLSKEGIDFRHVSTGDILDARGMYTEQRAIRQLAPDDVVKEIVVEKLNLGDNWFLDGFPRNVSQAKFLFHFATSRRLAVSTVYLAVNDRGHELATERIQARAKKEGRRHDATPEAIQRGFNVFHGETVPAFRFLAKHGNYPTVNIMATESEEEVARQLTGFVLEQSKTKPRVHLASLTHAAFVGAD